MVGIFLTIVTVVWWIVLFVSVFVNIPGLYTRGSGFTELAYAFITIFALINSIIFFATPLPRGVRALSLTLSIFLFVNALIILLAPPLRHHEGWVGLATVLWAAVVGGLWTTVTDRVVKWGKAEEEERLIGRVEERYTGTEWLKVILVTIGLIVVVILEVFITMTLILRLRDATLEPTGHKYWVQSHRFQVHVACFGNASSTTPLVFLEGGENSVEYFSSWVDEAQEEGLIGQYCYWDRPGYLISMHQLILDMDSLITHLLQCRQERPLMHSQQPYQKPTSPRKPHQDGSSCLTVSADFTPAYLHHVTHLKSKVSFSSIQFPNL